MGDYIRNATESDTEKIISFVGQAGANVEGINEIINHMYMLEEDNGKLKGVICVEDIEGDGMLRSLVIDQSCGIEDVLSFFKIILSKAKQKNLKDLFLLTKTPSSIQLLNMFGFKQVTKDETPNHIVATKHFQMTSESDTMIMKCSL
jgi:N-acetylglutamate synthase-like GNAT family acetyltransferase